MSGRVTLCFDLSGPRSRSNGQHFPDDFTMFRPKCVCFWHIFGVFKTKCVYLRSNEYIDVQDSCILSGGGVLSKCNDMAQIKIKG